MQFLLAVDAGRKQTPTHDEYWHLPLGLLIWKTGRFDYDVINPPLLRLWAALPLWIGGAKLDTEVPFVTPRDTGDLLWMSNRDYNLQWFAWGRAMVALMNLGTGWLLGKWARRWYGELAGFAAVLLFCTCPTILANGGLVTHDAAAAFGFVVTLYATVCWTEQPTRGRAAWAGFCLGIAQLLKLTCILLGPLMIVAWFLRPITSEKTSLKSWIGQWLLVWGIAIVVINVGYLGEQTGRSLSKMAMGSQRFQQLQQVPLLGTIPIPLPANYVRAFDRVAQDLAQKHPVFLDGDWSRSGYRSYYLEALLYKLPLGTLFLIAGAMVGCVANRRTNWRQQLMMVVSVLALLVPASLGANQIGIRYVLPVLPLLYLFASQVAMSLNAAESSFGKLRVLTRSLIVLAMVSLPLSLRYHPHHLAYFNEYAGGPVGGFHLLVDSNLDWGQDLHGLSDYLKREGIENPALAYFGCVHPHSLGIQFHIPPLWLPEQGDYAVSANFAQGRPFVVRLPTATGEAPIPTREHPTQSDDLMAIPMDAYAYLRFFEPKARIGNSIYVYQLTQQDVENYRQAIMFAPRTQ